MTSKVRSGEARFGWGKAVAGPGVRSQDGRKIGKKSLLFYLFIFIYRDSEGAFDSFWTRIRWGKAVAGPGVRSQKS